MGGRGRLLVVVVSAWWSMPLMLQAGCGGTSRAEPRLRPPPPPSDAPEASLRMACTGERQPDDRPRSGAGHERRRVRRRWRPSSRRRPAAARRPRRASAAVRRSATTSPIRPPARAATALHEHLAEEGIEPPYVAIGWSYGGVVTQAFASAYPTTSPAYCSRTPRSRPSSPSRSSVTSSGPRAAGGRLGCDRLGSCVGRPRGHSARRPHLGRGSGGVPPDLVRLPPRAGQASRPTRCMSSPLEAGHEIHADSEALEVALAGELVAAVRDGEPLAACDGRFARLDGRCA